MILVYVDDFVLWGIGVDEITNIKTLLNEKFSIKDLGVLKYFLGFKVRITLCQRKYTLELLRDIGLNGVKPCNTLMQPHL